LRGPTRLRGSLVTFDDDHQLDLGSRRDRVRPQAPHAGQRLVVGEPPAQQVARIGEHDLAAPGNRPELEELRPVQRLRCDALRVVPAERLFAYLIQPNPHPATPNRANAKAKGFPPGLSTVLAIAAIAGPAPSGGPGSGLPRALAAPMTEFA